MSNIASQIYEQYVYLEIPKGTKLESDVLENIKTTITESPKESKKILISLPPKYECDSKAYTSFLGFTKKSQENVAFVPQESLKWSKAWRAIIDSGLRVMEKRHAVSWATENFPAPEIETLVLEGLSYLKCKGNLWDDVSRFTTEFNRALKGIKLSQDIISPRPLSVDGITLWTSVKSGLVIDLASTTILGNKFFKTLNTVLENHELTPESPGIFFLTSGVFQSWFIKHCLGEKNINEIGNIIRVMPDNGKDYGEVIHQEAKALSKACKQTDPPLFLLTCQVQGAPNAVELCKRFYPDILIVDSISDASFLKDSLPDELKEKVYHVTPATDPGLMILGPQLITQGYDLKLFAEYLISRYNSNHGSPNDTFIYYLNTEPKHLKKVTSFFMYEFQEILGDKEKKLLDDLTQCETDASKLGSFLMALLQQSILKLEIELPLTSLGVAAFLSRYAQMFPHHFTTLCDPLRLFLKGDTSVSTIMASLHLIHDYNELVVKQEGFWIEARLQESKSLLTIKSNADERLEKRCFSLFAILNGSEIFQKLPDKEILITIISLLWENYSHLSKNQNQGFLITLQTSAENTELKVFQSEHNRIMLKEKSDGQTQIQFVGDFPYQKNTQKEVMKIISLFFTHNAQDPQENAWRFACFEATSQIILNYNLDQMLSLDLSIDGDRWCATFLSNAKEPNVIAARSQKVIESGAQKVEIATNGRRVRLIRNPTEEDLKEQETPEAQEKTIEKELEGLKEDAILKQVEDQKSKEAAARSAKLQNIYALALNTYNKKYGYEEEAETGGEKKGKTIEEALKTKILQKKQPDMSRREKIQRRIWIGTGVFVLLVVIGVVCLFTLTIAPTERGLFLTESKFPELATAPSPVVKQEIPVDPAQSLVQEISFKLNLGIPPSHDEINVMLKKIYLCNEQQKEGGDLHNLYGRMFLYKIYMDRHDKIFPKERVDRWFAEAVKAFHTAEEKYNTKKFQPSLKILIHDWKPERGWYPETQKDILYMSCEQAVEDVQKIKQNLGKLKEYWK